MNELHKSSFGQKSTGLFLSAKELLINPAANVCIRVIKFNQSANKIKPFSLLLFCIRS